MYVLRIADSRKPSVLRQVNVERGSEVVCASFADGDLVKDWYGAIVYMVRRGLESFRVDVDLLPNGYKVIYANLIGGCVHRDPKPLISIPFNVPLVVKGNFCAGLHRYMEYVASDDLSDAVPDPVSIADLDEAFRMFNLREEINNSKAKAQIDRYLSYDSKVVPMLGRGFGDIQVTFRNNKGLFETIALREYSVAGLNSEGYDRALVACEFFEKNKVLPLISELLRKKNA